MFCLLGMRMFCRCAGFLAQVASEGAKKTRRSFSQHLYSDKETAQTQQQGMTARDHLKLLIQTVVVDRASKYYFLSFGVLFVSGGAFVWYLKDRRQEVDGLVGERGHYRSRLTVVFDLDETLVSYGDKAFRLRAGLVPRPYLAELLDYLAEIDAEVIVWAACSDRYLKAVMAAIDPLGIRVSRVITRSSNWFSLGDHFYEKNLLWLKRDMNSTILIENRPESIRNCNANSILVDDWIRGEYMDNGQDYPPSDQALLTVKEIIAELHKTGQNVPEYLANAKIRHPSIKEIPCHLAMRQLPDELARGIFYFIGDKYKKGSFLLNEPW